MVGSQEQAEATAMDAPQQFDLSSNPVTWIAAMFAILMVAAGGFLYLRHRAFSRSIDARVLWHLATDAALARGHLQLHPAHVGFALSVDPRCRRALMRVGVDVDKMRKAFERSLHGLPAAAESYRGSQRPNLTLTPSTKKLVEGVTKHPTYGPRDWIRAAVVSAEIAPIMRQCGITMAKAVAIPELDVPRPGEIVVHDSLTGTEDFEKLVAVLSDVLSMDPVEAKAAALAVNLRKKEWFAIAGDDACDRLVEVARAYGLTLRAERS